MKTIPLTKGQFAIVDDEDFERLSQWKWHARFDKTTGGFYAERAVYSGIRKSRVRVVVRMHRFVVGAESNCQVDHRNLNTLDNRKENLRKASPSENSRNRRKRRGCLTPFKGVYLRRDSGRYQASIRVGGRNLSLGGFSEMEDAARAYDAAAKHYHGEFARLNFN